MIIKYMSTNYITRIFMIQNIIDTSLHQQNYQRLKTKKKKYKRRTINTSTII